jgi:hypothetical protein
MNRSLLALVTALLLTGPVLADLRPSQSPPQPITDPSMVVTDRGAKLEILANERAMTTVDNSGFRVLRRTIVPNAGVPIGPNQLGVVFNHAMQAHGYISGEITFKVKTGPAFPSQNLQLYPGLKLIIARYVYAVTARTPAEFIRVLKQLQARTDLDWVEPTVIYGTVAAPNTAPPTVRH